MTTGLYASEWDHHPHSAVIAVGSILHHGAHLPINTDALIADEIARRLASRLPAVRVGSIAATTAHEHLPLPGTVNVPAEACIAYVENMAAALRRAGFLRLVIVNGHHSGNFWLGSLVRELNDGEEWVHVVPTADHLAMARFDAGLPMSSEGEAWGGEFETSEILAIDASLARVDLARPESGEFSFTREDVLRRASQVDVEAVQRASAEKGERIFQSLIASIVNDLTVIAT